jgi:hypothetical protein
MKIFLTVSAQRRMYRFDIVGHKKALKSGETLPLMDKKLKLKREIYIEREM